MKLRSKGVALAAAVTLAIPAVAIGVGDRGPENIPPRAAYGVICERPPYDISRDNADFSECVRALAKGVNGGESASDAARTACRLASEGNPGGQEFGKCVADTKTMILGLRSLKS
jgi:hypothetical protein